MENGRHLPHLFQHAMDRQAVGLRVRIAGEIQVEANREGMLCRESRVHALKLNHAARHQAGADQQHIGERHLSGDQHVAEAAALQPGADFKPTASKRQREPTDGP